MNKGISLIKIMVYVVTLIVLISIPIDFIEGRSFCFFYNIFDFQCFGCGTTRAIFNMLHLNIGRAASYNVFAVMWFPICILIILQDIFISIKILLNSYGESIKLSLIDKIYMKIFHIIKGSYNIK